MKDILDANGTATAGNLTEAAAHLDLVITVAVLATLVAVGFAALVVWAFCSCCIHDHPICRVLRTRASGGGGGKAGGGCEYTGSDIDSCGNTLRFPPHRENLELGYIPDYKAPLYHLGKINVNHTGASEGLGLNMISVERNQVPTLAAPKTWTPSPPFGHTEPQPRQQCIAYREHDDAARTSSYPATPFNTLSSKGWSESQGGAMQTDNQTCPDVKNEHGQPEYTARRPAYRGRPCRENPLDLSFPLENRKRTSRNNKGRTSSCSCPDVWACKNQRSDFERFTPATHGPGDHFEVPRLQPRHPHSRLHGWEDRRRHHCPRCSQLAQCVCPSPSGSPTEILRTTGNTELQPSACSSRRSSPAKEANLVVSLDHGRQCARYAPSDHLTPTNHSPGFSNVSHNNKNYSRDHHHERSTHHRPPSSHRSQNERNQSRDQGSHICGRGAVPKRYKRKRSGSTAIPRTPGTRHECTPETSCFSEDEGQCRTVIRKSHLERKYGLIPKDQMDGSFWGKRHSRCDNHSSSDIPLPKDSALMSEASGEEKEDLEAEFDIADGELPAFAYPPDRDYYITCLPPSQDEESDQAGNLLDQSIHV